ncbi:probable b mating type locus, bE1 allele [Ustilago bromivora]|uniref:Probable b mating type locus, bE1 allele n=1 Tax=Ustilago bromivora TaxID=307758 RepID=A0A8H8TVU0_9BASI|nr:probable b mating type locus, bE1 allele [Ustilago bromivora]
MPVTSFTFSELLRTLQDIEDGLLRSAGGFGVEAISELSQFTPSTLQSLVNGCKDLDQVGKINQAARRIQLVAEARLCLEESSASLCAELSREANTLLSVQISSRSVERSVDLSENLPSYHMRRHFLATLHDPYPAAEDKEALVRITNESVLQPGTPLKKRTLLSVEQLTLWFINARRRSGWSQIVRKFARNDRNRMKLLVQAKMLASDPSARAIATQSSLVGNLDDLLRENLGDLTPADKEEFEDDWNSMISWIKYGVKEKVGDWVYDLVAANKKSPPRTGQARAVTTAANRSPARKTATKTQTKPRKAKQRASKTPSMDSTSVLESTPELSMCSTADNSFSSFGSNGSLVQHNPFQQYQLQQSPSLNTRGGRKVKALPKRATQKLPAEALYISKSSLWCPHKALDANTEQALCFALPLKDNNESGSIDTCYPVPEERKTALSLASEALAQVSGQTNSYLPASKQQMFPPYDAMGQIPFVPRRENLSSNSLSAAFG